MIFGSKRRVKLHTIFLLSALFFSFFSFFGVYTYKIYSWLWFILFYVYELLYYLGLRSARFVLRPTHRGKNEGRFVITRLGAEIICFFSVAGILSFIYFLYLYLRAYGMAAFGGRLINAFNYEGRTILEKFTLLVMQIGGDAMFLICAADESENYKKLKRLTCFTLFLPGLRCLLLGVRFLLATEFLTFFAIKWPGLKQRIKFSGRAKAEKVVIILLGLLIGFMFCYLFISRAAPGYKPVDRYTYHAGDMKMRPVWRKLYEMTDGKIGFIAIASDYLGEAPFVFSNYCTYNMPDKILWGRLAGRFFLQVLDVLFDIGGGFSAVLDQMAGGQYSGFAYSLIVDFGVALSFPAAFLFGRMFAMAERHIDTSRCCRVIYPTLKVICFFAPIYYFNVGRQDYTILFALIMAPFCLKRIMN